MLQNIRQPISLEHGRLLQQPLRALNLRLSEYTFADLFLFRRKYAYEVIQGDNHLYVKGLSYDNYDYLMPCHHPEQWEWSEVGALLDDVDFLFPIPELWLPFFDREKYHFDYHEDDSDYLYSSDTFAHYPGRRLSGRRNLVKQFHHANHYVESYPLEERIDDAYEVMKMWQKQHGNESYDLLACYDALLYHETLALHGTIYYVEEAPVGFIAGEMINDDTFAIHFFKADRTFKGIYQFIYQDFVQNLDTHAQYINLEQDLGDSHLRHAKRSYHPDELLKKWRVMKRKET